MKRALSAAILLATLGLSSGHAQVTTATFYGRVLDASGGAVPGAEVTMTEENTGATLSSNTSELGEFTFALLPVGRYSILVRHAGFKESRQTGMDLAAGQKVSVSYTLEVGEASQSVVVQSDKALIDTVSTQQQDTIDRRQIGELPLARRDWSNLLNLSTNASIGATGNSGGVVVNGLASAGFALTVDGTAQSGNPEINSIAAYQGPNYINVVSSEAIREIQFVRGLPSAEVANALSGNVNIITRSGANEYHGSGFFVFQDDALNARLPFSSSRQITSYKQFGGSFGGPVKRDHLFYFFTYEGYRQNSQVLISDTVPSLSLRNDAIARNPAYAPFLNLFPAPTSVVPGAISGVYQGLAYEKRTDNHYVGRVDYTSGQNFLAARYTHGRPYRENPRVVPANSQTTQAETDAGTFNFTHFNPSWTYETRFGYNRNPLLRLDRLYGLGMIVINDLGSSITNTAESYSLYGGDWSIEEVLAHTTGRHSLKFGGRYSRYHSGRDDRNAPSIAYSSAADLVANIPSSVSYPIDTLPFTLQRWMIGGFVQDDFKVRRNLVLNLGIRYDFYSVIAEKDGRMFNKGQFGVLQPPDRSYAPDYNDFSPRAGFAWTVDSSAKTVIRAGAGMFHTPPPLNMGVFLVRNGPTATSSVNLTKLQAQQYGITFPFTPEQVLPYAPAGAQPGNAVDPNLRTPEAYQWLFTVQRLLTRGVALETGYVGTRGLKLLNQRQLNQVDRLTGIRPVPQWTSLYFLDNTDGSSFHSWQTSVRSSFARSTQVNLHYTWAKNLTNFLGDLFPTGSNRTPQDPYNARADKGPANSDVTHRLAADFFHEIAPSRNLLGAWQVSGIFIASTGLPITATEGGTVSAQRPDVVSGDPYVDWSNQLSTRQYLNPAAFALVPISSVSGGAIRPGSLGRNALRLPSFWNLDFAIAKNFRFTEQSRLQFRADFFNGLNHTTYSGVDTNLGTTSRRATFGQFNATRNPRVIQLNARFVF